MHLKDLVGKDVVRTSSVLRTASDGESVFRDNSYTGILYEEGRRLCTGYIDGHAIITEQLPGQNARTFILEPVFNDNSWRDVSGVFDAVSVQQIIVNNFKTNIALLDRQYIMDSLPSADEKRSTLRQRQMDGIAAAREKGIHLGRPKLEFPDTWKYYYDKWKNDEITVTLASKDMEISRSSFYRLVKKYEENDSITI